MAAMTPMRARAASAAAFAYSELLTTRVVGFDLAGLEDDNPPENFVEEFRRLSRFHVPLTVHAGENATSQYIEDAVLELRARRIGHGLSLAEDPELMGRLREERVCIELCPISNHQTCHFVGADEARGRKYPLNIYLENELLVSIATDNPTVSYTDIIKEYYQASFSMGEQGLSVWDALRIMRMGLNAAFLPFSERHALIDLAEQRCFDLFSDPDVVRQLREFATE